MHSEWLCARCGLHRTTMAAGIASAADQPAGPARTRHRALKAAIGSGLTAKMLIGAAALAAVGGAVATAPPPVPVPPDPVPPVSTPAAPPAAPVPGELPPPANDRAAEVTTPGVIPAGRPAGSPSPDLSDQASMPDNVAVYLEAVRDWTACIDLAVHEFATTRPGIGGFDPFAACPDRPQPSAFALGRAVGRPDDAGSQRNDHGRPTDPGKSDPQGLG